MKKILVVCIIFSVLRFFFNCLSIYKSMFNGHFYVVSFLLLLVVCLSMFFAVIMSQTEMQTEGLAPGPSPGPGPAPGPSPVPSPGPSPGPVSVVFESVGIIGIPNIPKIGLNVDRAKGGHDVLLLNGTQYIPTGYYQINDDSMAQIPYGFMRDDINPKVIFPITKRAAYSAANTLADLVAPGPGPGPSPSPASSLIDLTDYNPPKTLEYNDVNYHLPASMIGDNDYDETYAGTMVIKDKDGNLVNMPWINQVQSPATYFKAGSMMYGPQSYVPNYEESVYMSRLTGLKYSSPVN
jgi:hypothetical protein